MSLRGIVNFSKAKTCPDKVPVQLLTDDTDAKLPIEVVELILDSIQSKQTLCICSLVCLTWLHHSRRRLFSRTVVRLNSSNRERFIEENCPPLDASLSVLPYIQNLELQLWYDVDFLDVTLPRLRGLTSLRSLNLDCVTSVQLTNPIKDSLRDHFGHIINLQLHRIEFANPAEFLLFMSAFPRLQRLAITYCYIFQAGESDLDQLRPHQLRVFELETFFDNITSKCILQWLCHGARTLNALSVCHRQAGEKATVNPCFQLAGSTLEHLKIHPVRAEDCDLSNNQLLRRIEFGPIQLFPPDLPPGSVTTLTEVLHTVTSRNVESILFTLSIFKASDIEILDWTGLSAVLEGANFGSLKRLAIYMTKKEIKAAAPLIRNKLPVFASRPGFLHILPPTVVDDTFERFPWN